MSVAVMPLAFLCQLLITYIIPIYLHILNRFNNNSNNKPATTNNNYISNNKGSNSSSITSSSNNINSISKNNINIMFR